MTTLTFDAIRDNPWNVVSQHLPGRPAALLLVTAYLAADYCRTSEYCFIVAAREGIYIPRAWRPSANCKKPHEQCEQRRHAAHRRLEEIRKIYKQRFGKDLDELTKQK